MAAIGTSGRTTTSGGIGARALGRRGPGSPVTTTAMSTSPTASPASAPTDRQPGRPRQGVPAQGDWAARPGPRGRPARRARRGGRSRPPDEQPATDRTSPARAATTSAHTMAWLSGSAGALGDQVGPLGDLGRTGTAGRPAPRGPRRCALVGRRSIHISDGRPDPGTGGRERDEERIERHDRRIAGAASTTVGARSATPDDAQRERAAVADVRGRGGRRPRASAARSGLTMAGRPARRSPAALG